MMQPSLAPFMVTFRQIMATRLHTPQGEVHHTHLFSPTLSALPTILDDTHLFHTFASLWLQQIRNPTFEHVRLNPIP